MPFGKRPVTRARAKTHSCDHGHETTGKVRRLGTGGGSAVIVCRQHWNAEMAWRKQRNKTLTGKAKFPIRAWPGG